MTLAFRLCLVYFGASAAGLWLAHRFVRRMTRFAALCLIAGPLLFVGRALLSGGIYAPLDIAYDAEPLRSMRAEMGVGAQRPAILGDVVYQEIPWRQAAREALGNGRIPLWNRFVLAGEPLLATQQPAVLHPATWLSLLLPLAQAWTLEMALRLFLALASAYLLFREQGCGEVPSGFGAAAWAFSDYLIFYLGYPLAPAAAPLPLLVLGLRRLCATPSRRSAALVLAALLLIITAGHPESALHVTAAAGVFFLFDLHAAGRGRRAKPLLLSLGVGLLALGLCAVLLLPFLEAAPQTLEYLVRRGWYTHTERSLPLIASLNRSASNLVPFPAGVREPSAYAGSLVLPFALLGLFSRRRERWPMLLTAFLGLAAFGRLPLVNDAICRLPLFDIALNERMAFFGSFSLAGLAAYGVDKLRAGEGRKLAIAGSVVLAAAIGALSLRAPSVRPWTAPLGGWKALLPGAAPLLLLAIGLSLAKIPRAMAAATALAAMALLAQRRVEMGGLYPTFSPRAFYPRVPLLDRVPRGAPFRFVGLGRRFIPNIAAMYGLEDARGYEAMTFAPLVETFPLWCVPQPVWFNRVDDPTKPFLSFLNVRFALAPRSGSVPPDWKVLAEDAGGRLLENPHSLPRLFVPRRLFREVDATRQRERLLSITDFEAEGVVEGGPAGVAENGAARVEIASYAPQKVMTSVEANERAVVATSLTRWPGWRLEIDDREAPLLVYNRAFLAFEVPAGRHRAVLLYRPGSFVAGSWISVLSLLSLIAITAWPRRRGP